MHCLSRPSLAPLQQSRTLNIPSHQLSFPSAHLTPSIPVSCYNWTLYPLTSLLARPPRRTAPPQPAPPTQLTHPGSLYPNDIVWTPTSYIAHTLRFDRSLVWQNDAPTGILARTIPQESSCHLRNRRHPHSPRLRHKLWFLSMGAFLRRTPRSFCN